MKINKEDKITIKLNEEAGFFVEERLQYYTEKKDIITKIELVKIEGEEYYIYENKGKLYALEDVKYDCEDIFNRKCIEAYLIGIS